MTLVSININTGNDNSINITIISSNGIDIKSSDDNSI